MTHLGKGAVYTVDYTMAQNRAYALANRLEQPVMKRAIVAAVLLVAMLSGCSAPQVVTTPTPTPDSNRAACLDTSTVSKDLAARVVKGSDASNAAEFKATMDSMRGRFDDAGLEGSGDVKSRIELLVADLPDPVFMLSLDSSQYFKDLASVSRACKAAGVSMQVYGWGVR